MEKRIKCPKCNSIRNHKLVGFCPVCISPDEYKKRRKLIEDKRKKKKRDYYLKHREDNLRKACEYRMVNRVAISRRNKINIKRKQLNRIRCKERYYKLKQNPILFQQFMKEKWAIEKAKKYEKV